MFFYTSTLDIKIILSPKMKIFSFQYSNFQKNFDLSISSFSSLFYYSEENTVIS